MYHTVHFADYNGTPLSTVENVLDGTRLDSIAPTAPTRTGYTFVQWTPPETYITGDTPTEFFFTAQYRSTKLYDLHIKYVYENNSPAALPYQATLPYGEAYQVASPTIQGFYVDPADDEMISGTAGVPDMDDTQLDHTVVYKASTGTPYKVEHYLQNISDDDYTLAPELTDNLTATTGSQITAYAKDIPNFTAHTPTQTATIAPDGSTVVKMYYDRICYILTFDTAGGTFIPPFQGRYGAAIPPVADPTRTGYTFAGWSVPIPGTLTQSQTITAQWTAHSNVNYTLVYWIEDADPIPGTSTYEYSYHSAATRTGTAGAVYTITQADRPAIQYFTYDHYDMGVAIAGDGSTVINIYYTRNSYTVEFNLNRYNATLTIGGATYTYPQRYSFTAKYESNISDLWPIAQHIPPVGRYEFNGWQIGYTGSIWTSKQTRLTSELINPTGTRTFTAQWSTRVALDLHYMFEDWMGPGLLQRPPLQARTRN